MTLYGKGFYIWRVLRCEAGDVNAVANLASQCGLSHILVKIADGSSSYNVNTTTGEDYALELVQALRERNIACWGWHYVYGYEPLAEADIAIQRIQELGLDGYTVDAEAPYKEPGRDEDARQFLTRLRQVLGSFPIALSSYRFPTYHPQFPFEAFLEQVDTNMPQMYWVGAHNPAEQLQRCLSEYENLTPFRPIMPTGSAYLQGDWQPTPADIQEFLNAARALNMTAANFWEWANCRQNLPEIWDAICAFPWPPDPANEDIVVRYIAALNTHNPATLLALYNDNAAHVTARRTIQGPAALNAWYQELFTHTLPNATFSLGEFSGRLGSRHFTWSAVTPSGLSAQGSDSFGLVDGKITYHYTAFTSSP
ncbi:MAG: nuclear transport factor 2 family protein [Chloroflexota bacterium]